MTYENKGFNKKMHSKLVLNRLKIMGGPTPIYILLGISFKKTSIEIFMCASTKETF
jgi:hypothetical protein